MTWVQRPARGQGRDADVGSFTICIPRSYSPETVLIDVERKLVLRVRGTPAPEQRTAIPLRLSKHVTVPSFRVLNDGQWFLEQYVDGQALSTIAHTSRLAAFRRLSDGYTSLARTDGSGSAYEQLRGAVAAVRAAKVPPALTEYLQKQGDHLLKRALGWPLVPSHGDLTADNVLVHHGEPVLVDFEWCGWYPFFYDVLCLALREAADCQRTDLLVAVLDERPDRESGLLAYRGNGIQEGTMELLVVATMLIRCHTAAQSKGRLDRNKFERYVAHFWPTFQQLVGERHGVGGGLTA